MRPFKGDKYWSTLVDMRICIRTFYIKYAEGWWEGMGLSLIRIMEAGMAILQKQESNKTDICFLGRLSSTSLIGFS